MMIVMKWDVVAVSAEPDWALSVRFADGLSGRVRFSPDFFRGVFEPISDPEMFRRVFVDQGAVAWPGELDLAPDAMYEQIQANGEWLVGAGAEIVSPV